MYSKLSGTEPHFRLLLVLPGDRSTDIQCQLLVSSLDHPLEFEALSYVWGDATDTIPISLQGQTHNVTRNLYSALHHLRYSDRVRTLWVDALCINQEDIDERNHQVRLMGCIYSAAKCVVAWLGPSCDKDLEIIRFIETVGGNQNVHWTELATRGIDPLPLFMFLRNRWWDRIWTAQEAVLARNLTYQRGSWTITGETMSGMLNSFNVHMSSCCIDLGKDLGSQMGYYDLMGLIRIQRNLGRVRNGIYGRSFCQIANHFRHRSATDPRDKIYGLLGMIEDAEHITIDYSLSVEMIYEVSAREIITKTRSLDLLSHLTETSEEPGEHEYSRKQRTRATNLPSWVPDWSDDFNTFHDPSFNMDIRIRTLNLFNACGPYLFDASNGDEQGSLRVKGINFDVIENVNPALQNSNTVSAEAFRDWRIMAGIEDEPDKSYPSGGTIMDAFWRTLSLDLSSSRGTSESGIPFERAGPGDRPIHDTFWFLSLLALYNRPKSDRLPETFQNQEEGNVFSQHTYQTTYNRRFFLSKRGYMGLAPKNAKSGDMICVLAGGRLPFILRSAERVSEQTKIGLGTESQYTIVGDAYLHGIMDGEAMKKINEGEQSFQTFQLI
ncbi:HET-domain-containing protein [Daldinia vernicosa]|uniref:HET-domain-containing protein n=1 Tax=Daldinia vernicosa TaxID=114800 RepID=UPI0020075631|nr:HET-domain-containing protein [Daldinia vernicosa]KAI0850028.1 HET-domain-containing protein [Daldinia vernicosa]